VSTTIPTNRALPVSVVARRLALDPKTVYRRIASGDIAPVIRLGRTIRVPESTLASLLEQKGDDAA
jgi:excisionase family DNA binding protein